MTFETLHATPGCLRYIHERTPVLTVYRFGPARGLTLTGHYTPVRFAASRILLNSAARTRAAWFTSFPRSRAHFAADSFSPHTAACKLLYTHCVSDSV